MIQNSHINLQGFQKSKDLAYFTLYSNTQPLKKTALKLSNTPTLQLSNPPTQKYSQKKACPFQSRLQKLYECEIFYGIFLKPSAFIFQLPSLGKPGYCPVEASQPSNIIATVVKTPPFPGR